MATVAHWAGVQLHGPTWRPVASPRRWARSRSSSRAHAPRSRHTVIVQGAASSPAHQWRPNDDKVHRMSTTTAQATRRYTYTSMEMAKKGSSPEQRRFSGDVWCRCWETAPNSDRSSWARFLSFTSKPRALEALRRSLPVMRSGRESSHWGRMEVTHVIRDGPRRNGLMIMKPGAK
jgi:hypothetical protein